MNQNTLELDIIQTTDLVKQYPGMEGRALDGIDLAVHRGEVFGLLGPNGAGKTTFAGVLTTRVVPTSGRALIAGIDVAKHPALVKQISGIVSQQNTLDRRLNVWENLYFHGRLFGIAARESRRRADALLEQFTLTKWARQSVYTLSGGMAQRLMVARAIFHEPAVLFLDEPTAGLDPQSRLALWELLGQLNAAGQTVMLTTHYMEEADQLCDRVAIMDRGRVLALDTPENLKRLVGADTLVTLKVAAGAERLAAALAGGLSEVVTSRVSGGSLTIETRGADRLVPRLVALAESVGVDILDLTVAEPSLETVFINLTGKELRES